MNVSWWSKRTYLPVRIKLCKDVIDVFHFYEQNARQRDCTVKRCDANTSGSAESRHPNRLPSTVFFFLNNNEVWEYHKLYMFKYSPRRGL